MRKCHHGLTLQGPWDSIHSRTMTVQGKTRLVTVHICWQCGLWLPLGHSDEHSSKRIEIEIGLAELLAQTECEWEPCGAKDEQFDLYVDIFATDEPPQLRKPGPRSPIEMMVDAACGYTRKDQPE